MDDERLYFIASDISISEKKSNDIFLYVGMRLQSTRPNGNGEGVTEPFIDEIVNNQEKYNCLPLYVDVDRLRARDYRSLGHMYNRNTGKFNTTQIGGFFAFKKVYDEYGVSLMGEARIPKREAEICQGIMELYALGILNFSFEIKYVKSDTIIENGVQYVDASENNALTGVAVVSVPAYRESTALSLVAEDHEIDNTDDHDEYRDHEDEHEMDKPFDNDELSNVTKGVDTMTQEEAMSLIAEKDQKIADLEAKAGIAEAKMTDLEKEKEAVETEKKAKEDELTNVEAAKKKCAEDLNAANDSIAEKDQTITELQQKIAELEPMKAELETLKAEAEATALKEKQEKAKSFAEKQGLDTEKKEVADAIASLNYEAIASYAMEIEQPADKTVKLASFMSDGMEIKDKYNGLLARR